MDQLRAMRTFVQIANDGSLTAAARSLNCSLPTVVRLLADLESHLGVRLLNRTTRRLSLTAEGQHYLEQTRTILAAIDESEAFLRAGQIEPGGTLRVTAPVQFGQRYVAPAVTGFVRRYPAVKCQLELNDRNVDLLQEGLDVGVRIGSLPDSTLVARQVGHVRRMVVAAPAYLKHQGVPLDPWDLQQGKAVLAHRAMRSWRFQDKGKTFTVPVEGNLEFNQIAPAIEACVAGMGFGMFLSYQVGEELHSGSLVRVLADFELPVRPVNVIYPHAGLLPARTRLFVDWLCHALNGVTSMQG